MKKWIVPVLVAALVLACLTAHAETVLDGISFRSIIPEEEGENIAPAGVSPTTGRTLSTLRLPTGCAGLAATGRYLPLLVQIDNTDNGAGVRAPWGVGWADIVYESLLRREGQTRISLLFSDIIPDDIGPVRSARIGHAWLREEWDCAFAYYGQQEYYRSNVQEEFRRLGVAEKGLLFSGTVPTWKRHYYARKNLVSPHDKGVDGAGLISEVNPAFTAPNHAFRFTDTPAQGDPAVKIKVDWGRKDYYTEYQYSETLGSYTRTIRGSKGMEAYRDLDSAASVTFANVIVQWVDMDWVQEMAPVMRVTGDADFFTTWGDGTFVAQDNADYFMNGVHVAGFWRRNGMHDRTVFYDAEGHEISLQRGRTMILLFPCVERLVHENRSTPTVISIQRSVSYE